MVLTRGNYSLMNQLSVRVLFDFSNVGLLSRIVIVTHRIVIVTHPYEKYYKLNINQLISNFKLINASSFNS